MELPATEFKAKCLAYLDQVAQTHASITLTKHGRAVARLVPVEDCRGGRVRASGGYGAGARLTSIRPIDEAWDADA